MFDFRPPEKQKRDLHVLFLANPLLVQNNKAKAGFMDGCHFMRLLRHIEVSANNGFTSGIGEFPNPELIINAPGLMIINDVECIIARKKLFAN